MTVKAESLHILGKDMKQVSSSVHDNSPGSSLIVHLFTAWAKDSGDSSWYQSESEDSGSEESNERHSQVVYEVEYEVDSDSNNSSISDPDDNYDSSSSDVEEVILPLIAAAACHFESDDGDSEDSEVGIIRSSPINLNKNINSDKWTCLRCRVQNKPPMRYCARCYKIRKNWLPERPKGKNRKRRRLDGEDGQGSSVSISSSQPTDSGVESQANSLGDFHSGSSNDNVCQLCFVKPRDGTIVHGKSGHRRYCYTCAKKIWKKKLPCPFCRQKIEKVIKDFDVDCDTDPGASSNRNQLTM